MNTPAVETKEPTLQRSEIVAVVLCLVPIGALLGRIASLSEYVTIGPRVLPIVGQTSGRLLDRFVAALGVTTEIDSTTAAALALVAVGISAAVSRQLAARGYRGTVVHLLPQAALLVAALALGYRFPSFLGLVGLFGFRLASRKHVVATWIATVLCIVMCGIPIDITLRDFEGPPRWTSAESCQTHAEYEAYLSDRRVCVSTDASVYREPRIVWVW